MGFRPRYAPGPDSRPPVSGSPEVRDRLDRFDEERKISSPLFLDHEAACLSSRTVPDLRPARLGMCETHLNPGSDLSGFISHVGLGMPRHLGEALSVSQSTRALAMEEAHTFGVLPASSTRELCKPIRALRFSVRC